MQTQSLAHISNLNQTAMDTVNLKTAAYSCNISTKPSTAFLTND